MIQHFLVDVTFNDPYPKKSSYRVEARKIALGLYRGAKQFRKEFKGRKIKDFSARVVRI